MNRRFITGDVSPVACRVIIERLHKAGIKNFEVKQIPKTKEEWHLTDGHKFAEMICEFMGWECNPKKSGDGGIDGWARNGKIPVQIKHHKHSVGRDHLQKFVGALNGYSQGIFVGWNFSPHSWDYVHIAKRDFKKDITLIPAHQILGELVLTLEQRLKYQKLYEKAVKASKHGKLPLEMVS
ncbi:MAG: restriction endonuclease [Gammaproteobacteria bacterium]|nr:restriction endonuclease [Gammaproteobacteria bacterium]